MSSIVLDLQQDVTQPDCDIVNVLRRAHLIASKLGLSEFDSWIMNELNGYGGNEPIPEYRRLRGVLKALNPYHGWIPTLINDDELVNKICTLYIPNSISELVSLCAQGENGLLHEFSGENLSILNHIFDTPMPMTYALHLSPPSVADIIEKVKNAVLEWTIRLEAEGILGDGMQFNSVEKGLAHRIPQTVNNYFGNTNVINAPQDHATIVAGNDTQIDFSYDAVKQALSEIESTLSREDLSPEDQESIEEILQEIKEKVSCEKKPSVIKASLAGLKDFLLGVGASATVAIIQAKMQGLF